MTGGTAGKARSQACVHRDGALPVRRDRADRVEMAVMRASQLPTARQSRTGGRTARTATAEPAPLVLERYRLQRRLGAGAFGTVWAARDERLDREVAVKIVPRQRVLGGRFEREARAAARLAHPAIVTLYEAAVDDEGAYLVSELVHGATLHDLLDEGRLSDRDIVELAISLCDALSHAHAAGVIHRDVKPSNVLVPERPTSPAHPAKLTDFGVALVIGGDSLTRTGDVVGTAAYMAPEQAEGREAGASADLYSLALVVYEALTGVNPVRTGTAASRARRLGAHLPPLRRQRRDLPRELGCGIDLALRPRPRERGTVEELRTALVAALPQVADDPGVAAGGFTRAPTATAAPEPWAFAPATEDHDGDTQDWALPADTGPTAWIWRGAAAVGAAASVGWIASRLLAPGSCPPAVLGSVAAILVLLLPRIGWLASTLALAALAASQDRAGGALVVLLAMLVPVISMPRRGVGWPLSAGAVALGLVGLAGAWPAAAARIGHSAWRRAALGLAGWAWLVCSTPLAGSDLYAAQPASIPAPGVWIGSVPVTFHHVLGPILSSGLLAPAPVWALAAVVLPWCQRAGSLALEVVLVTVWAAILVSATEVALGLGGHPGAPAPRGAVLGAVAGGLVALAPALHRAWRNNADATSPGARLP
jgi:eukaryotic-like serine/threonine-protein kinase